jgi:hypothetical protein
MELCHHLTVYLHGAFFSQEYGNVTITLPTPNIEFKSNYFEEMDTFHSIHLKAYSLRREYFADRIGLWRLVF